MKNGPFSRAFQHGGTSDESEMDKLEKDLTGKLKLLKFTFEKTSDIVSKTNIAAIERQCEALVKITGMIEEIKLKILEGKFERNDDPELLPHLMARLPIGFDSGAYLKLK